MGNQRSKDREDDDDNEQESNESESEQEEEDDTDTESNDDNSRQSQESSRKSSSSEEIPEWVNQLRNEVQNLGRDVADLKKRRIPVQSAKRKAPVLTRQEETPPTPQRTRYSGGRKIKLW